MLTNSNRGGSLELNCHKSKGFTLIELISVIILMGVIALITVPIIKDTIESAREKNFNNSALGLIEAANEYYLNSKLTGDYFEEIEFKVNNGKMISGNKELSFNGKVPVGDSYVKIKANGDVAINITDGEFYAVKDYDEIGASIGTSEDTALLREELAKKIAELEKIVSDNKSELENKINSNFDKVYPVGSIYISTSSANPSTIYGGTWERYGQGKTLVGLNEGEPEFNTINKTGGEKTHTLTINEIPSHNHGIPSLTGSTNTAGEHNHLSYYVYGYTGWTGDIPSGNYGFIYNSDAIQNPSSAGITGLSSSIYSGLGGSHNHTLTTDKSTTNSTGGSQPHNNLQPYITVYMWKRVS